MRVFRFLTIILIPLFVFASTSFALFDTNISTTTTLVAQRNRTPHVGGARSFSRQSMSRPSVNRSSFPRQHTSRAIIQRSQPQRSYRATSAIRSRPAISRAQTTKARSAVSRAGTTKKPSVKSKPAKRSTINKQRSRAAKRSHRQMRRHNFGRYYWGPTFWWGYGYAFPFGCHFYPGWGWWYYPRFGCSYYSYWGCWYYDSLGYWYYPGLRFGAYIASRPDRIMYVDNDSDDDLFYAVYYRRRVGDVYYLYRVDEPSTIGKRRAVKVHLPKGKDSDYMVVAEKTVNELPERMNQDKTGKVLDVGKKDAVRSASEVVPGSREKIKVEALSKKDKRELKKIKKDMQKKNKKLNDLSSKIEKVKNPEAEAKEKALKRIDAAKEDEAGKNGGKNAIKPIGIDAD